MRMLTSLRTCNFLTHNPTDSIKWKPHTGLSHTCVDWGLSWYLKVTCSMFPLLDAQAARTWWHVGDEGTVYNTTFNSDNEVTGVVWSNKRENGLWFAPADRRECRLGIQLLPIIPVTETLFQDVAYVKQLVNWAMPALSRAGVEDGWKGFVYSLQGVYDRDHALASIRSLKSHDDGNSLTNLLWWVYSR